MPRSPVLDLSPLLGSWRLEFSGSRSPAQESGSSPTVRTPTGIWFSKLAGGLCSCSPGQIVQHRRAMPIEQRCSTI